VAEFFSFGTNDLHATTMGLSATTPAASCPITWTRRKPLYSRADPFQFTRYKGVGMLSAGALEQGRKTRPKLKIGHLRRAWRRCGQREFAIKSHGTTSVLLRSACPCAFGGQLKLIVEEKQAKEKEGK